jgi:phosphatidylserine decarboxylase
MTVRPPLAKLFAREDLNFVLTNGLPRQLATRFIGWFSQIEHPLLARAAIAVWKQFAELDLGDARAQRFDSVHACFTRELKPGARPIESDPSVMTSPCDAIVGASGRVAGDELLQIKGFTYTLQELLIDRRFADRYRDGLYVTLRLTSGMYHRFHAPHDCTVDAVRYVSGDIWNVNPPTLRRVAKLFCKNERAIVRTVLSGSDQVVTLVPVGAILVASIRLHFLATPLDMNYRGNSEIPCHAPFRKGEEMGWFQHGSTIIVLAPPGFALCDAVREGSIIRMGRPLMRLPR